MVAIDLKSLVGKLTETGRRQLEAAAGLTLSRSHYNVEIEHVLLKLVELSGSDIATILRKQSVDAGQVAAELNRALDRLRTGNARPPALSPDIVTWLREAWIIASLEAGSTRIRSGHMLAALLADEALSRTVRESCPTLTAVPAAGVRGNLAELAAGSDEAASAEAPAGLALALRARVVQPRHREVAGRWTSSAPTSRPRPSPAGSIRSWDVMPRYGRWSTSSRGGGRTTPS